MHLECDRMDYSNHYSETLPVSCSVGELCTVPGVSHAVLLYSRGEREAEKGREGGGMDGWRDGGMVDRKDTK